jgi:hypothetical protein
MSIDVHYYSDPQFSYYIRKEQYAIIAKLYVTSGHNTFKDKKTLNIDKLITTGKFLPENIFFFS